MEESIRPVEACGSRPITATILLIQPPVASRLVLHLLLAVNPTTFVAWRLFFQCTTTPSVSLPTAFTARYFNEQQGQTAINGTVQTNAEGNRVDGFNDLLRPWKVV
jgi:hypothetical protein